MYSIGDVLYSKSSITDKTLFYVVADKFTNYFNDIVYVLETLEDKNSNKYMKFNELQKFMDSWIHKAEDLTIF